MVEKLIEYVFLADWVFGIPNLYENCNEAEEICKDMDADIKHVFKKDFEAPSNITLTCSFPTNETKGYLPDWYWETEGFKFKGFVPSCYDPTYCEDDPPVPNGNHTSYRKPRRGSVRYEDGEIVKYKCDFPGKFEILQVTEFRLKMVIKICPRLRVPRSSKA